MEYVIPVLIVFIIINTTLKISFWRWWQAAAFSAVAAAFVLLAVPYAVSQSKTEMAAWLQNPDVMQNVAVLITVESVIFLAFAFMRFRGVLGVGAKRYAMAPLEAYPGLLLLPVLFYTLTQLIFILSGVSFGVVGYVLAAAVFIILPLLARVWSKLVPEEELRLEMQFIVTLFVCIIGLITTVNGKTAYAPVQQPLDMGMLLCAIVLFLLLFVGGFLWHRYKKKKVE